MDDGELVRQALNGGHSAFAILVERYTILVRAYCRYRIWRLDVVDDLAQETFLRAWRDLRSLKQPDKFGGFLLGIAKNLCRNWRKARQNSQTRFSDLEGDGQVRLDPRLDPPAPDDAMRDDMIDLMACVRRLPRRLRETVMLYFSSGLAYRQLGDLLGISAAMVNKRLTQARERLRRCLRSSVITSLPPRGPAVVSHPWQYQVLAQDGDGDALTYHLHAGPTGMAVNATTGLVTWTPAANQVGSQHIAIAVSDGRGAATLQSFDLLVVPTAPNDPPGR
jgi:RNA polymerase sigma factor (sigma-70 family)